MSVSFNSIPVNLMTPGVFVEFDNSQMVQGTPAMPHKILVMGQRLATGAVQAGVPTRLLSAAQAQADFGRGSQLAAMVAAVKGANPFTEAWAVALDDLVTGVAAQGTVTLTATSPAAGGMAFYVAGRRVQVSVASTDTAATLATALAAAINADGDMPVTATAALGVVTLTCRWKGLTGNDIDLRHSHHQGERLPTGVTLAISPMAGGLGNPDVNVAIAAMGATQYHTLVMPYTDATNLSALETELALRWGPLKMSEGHAFAAVAGTHAAISTLASGQNSPHLCLMGVQKSPTAPWVVASVLAAVDAGEPDPARPRQTLVLTGVMAPSEADRYLQSERNVHLTNGAATFVVDAGGECRIERLVTTYKTNAQNLPDPSYKDVETLRTLAYLRYSVRVRVGQKFPRHKLATEGTRYGSGQAVVTPSVLKAELIALFAEWEEAGLVEGRAQFKRDLLIERDAGDANRVNAIIPPDVINQMRVMAAQIQPRL